MTKKTQTKKLPRRYQPGFLRRMDRRTSFAKRLRRVFYSIVEDLGGEDSLSMIQLTLVERFAWLKAHLQQLEDEMAKQSADELDPKTVAQWVQSNNCMNGLAKTLGLKKKAKTPDLRAYLSGKKKGA